MTEGPRGTPLDLRAVADYLAERRASPIAELGLLDSYCTVLLAHCRALRAALAAEDEQLREWLRTPFFNTRAEWQAWVDGFRPRVRVATERAAAVLAQGRDE